MTGPTPADVLRARIRAALTEARKARDAPATRGLRALLAAIDNAEAPDPVPLDLTSGGHIAGSTPGLAATEVGRRSLDDRQLRALVRAEVAELRARGAEYDDLGQAARAAELRAEADAIEVADERPLRRFAPSTRRDDDLPVDSAEPPRQHLVTLDVEGVLIPEIWIAVAERTGIAGLRRTTRDEPDYDVLMRYRLDLLAEHGLTMSLIEDVIAGMTPLDGAREFLDQLRSRTQVVLLSDTFEQFARPLMRQLGWPTVLCHRLVVDDDRIVDYRLRQHDQKRRAVEAFRSLDYRVIAAGDSYNDTSMLAAADAGFLFRAPDNVIAEFPRFPALREYDDLLVALTEQLEPA